MQHVWCKGAPIDVILLPNHSEGFKLPEPQLLALGKLPVKITLELGEIFDNFQKGTYKNSESINGMTMSIQVYDAP